ncbi:MAG: chorismate mutase, partial [Firmicutes bacterium]|nr:chorismate mutase [Bacillota bacterium]
GELVEYLVDLKKGETVRDPAREKVVLGRVKEIAVNKGFDPEVIEEIYSILFRHFVRLQDEKRKSKNKHS